MPPTDSFLSADHDPVLAALTIPAAVIDTDGRLQSVNSAWQRQAPFGLTAGVILAEADPALHPLADALQTAASVSKDTPSPSFEMAEPADGRPRESLRWWRFVPTRLNANQGLLTAEDASACHQTLQLLHSVVEDQTELVCRFTPDTTLTFVNRAYCTFFSRTADELLGRRFITFVPEDQRDALTDKLARLTPENPLVTYEHPVTRPDGSPGWQAWTDRAFFDTAGRAVEFQSVGRDLTATKQLESEQEFRRRETQLILDSVPALIWFKDAHNRIVRLNQAAANVIGRPVTDIEGHFTAEFFPDHAEKYHRDDLEVFASGRSRLGIIEPLVDAGKATRWLRTDKVPLRVGARTEGPFDRILALSVDVTDQVQAEDRIRSSEERFRSLFDRVPTAVFEQDLTQPHALVQRLKAQGITDPEPYLNAHPEIVRESIRQTRIRGVNQAVLDLYCATSNEHLVDAFNGQNLGDVTDIGRRKLIALWNDSASIEFEAVAQTLDGRSLDLLYRMDIPRNPDGTIDPARALISTTDLTERTRRLFDEARMQQAAEERRDLGHQLHDTLGQQLTGLSMLTAALQHRMAARGLPEAQDVAELGGLIKEANQGVRRVIRGLTPETITAADLPTAITGLLDNAKRMHDLQVALAVAPPPPGLTDAQANHLLMIAGEAIHNAAKHGQPQQITVSLTCEPDALRLTIHDDGIGITGKSPDAPDLPARPDPRQYSRDHPDAPPLVTRNKGRGLPIMQYRARQIGATIKVYSPPGGGTTVRCHLPLPPARDGHAPPRHPPLTPT